MLHRTLLLVVLAGSFGLSQARAQEPAAHAAAGLEWNAVNVEHLYNRAGFGARPNEIEFALRGTQEQFVEQLLEGFTAPADPLFIDLPEMPQRRDFESREEFDRAQDRFRREERRVLTSFAGWWIDQMVDARHPLQERMVLFWHGYFTSSTRDVKRTGAMVAQNELFRRHALGNFAELVHAIVRDPAMLEYLDNNQNRKDSPNENLARELMELFTLGEGNYTEQDIKEGARALTGWRTTDDKAGSYFQPRQHDDGQKTILGKTARFDATSFVELLLEQPACLRWVARKLLVHFEGVEPDAKRLEEYAKLLKDSKWELKPFFRKLFLDPRFYAKEVLAERISSPVEYLVGCTRRLGLTVPPQVIWLGAGQLGQRLFDPPSVKGWDGGEAWITTSTLLGRGNMAGMLIGVVKIEDVLREDPLEIEPDDGAMMDGDTMGGDGMTGGDAKADDKEKGGKRAAKRRVDLGPEMGGLQRFTNEFYFPRINLTARMQRAGATRDPQIVDRLGDELLPVPLSETSRTALLNFLRIERSGLALEDGKLLTAGVKAEDVLRRLAHLILSLPEAQLG
ncbi:MAG: DUF1800 domain-containing protein [Planctomycetota bacterium]|nr:DUF1800 domain-containing protein [Planctomycetota bacterium]